jgi:hypothetical protein
MLQQAPRHVLSFVVWPPLSQYERVENAGEKLLFSLYRSLLSQNNLLKTVPQRIELAKKK